MPKEKMLLGGKKFWVGRARIGGCGGDGDGRVDVECNGWEADFIAAGLVAQFQGNFLGTEWGVGLRGERYAENDSILVHVERSLGKGECVELAFGVGDFAGGLETGREVGAEISGNKVLGGRLARVDVEAVADFEHDGELEGGAASDGFERNVCGWSDDFAARGDLRMCGWQRGDDYQQDGCDGDSCGELHRRTG
jgi:hypothetical protein